MTNIPTGTVTFLFTDIEGSTKLWEHHPDAMKTALARHDSLLRQMIESNRGYVFKTVGDAFCAAFPTAREALRAAIEGQRALQGKGEAFAPAQPHSEPDWNNPAKISDDQDLANASPLQIRVRMALHSGNAEERDGDYFGPPLNRVARLMCGHGGQALLSQAVFDLVCDQLPPNISLRDLGEHRLKDLMRPEHIYQVIAPDLPIEFPALKTLEALPNNLPIQLTSFIGREKEIRDTEQLLSKTRLLTLTGAGGCGKTRLAVQVAAELLEEFASGVWFVELASLTDPALVPQSIASALNLQEQGARPIQDTLIDFLREKTTLLLLDNCEHLIDACARLADMLLHACPNLKILATSREALGIAGELAWRVPSLSLPPTDFQSLPDFGNLSQYEAVKLFIDRACFAVPSFTVTNANAPAVAQICHRLDGIPLAIELAASRVKVLSVEEINARLDNRFRLLTGGSRTALPRQQTLHALIDWSYSLLSEQERIFLRRLSVFAGGCTCEAVEAICTEEGIDPYDTLDFLTNLINKSLVLTEEHDGTTRYRMLETIRQYAREKLLESGEAERVHDRHLDFFLALADEAEPNLRNRKSSEWTIRLLRDVENFRVALGWSLDHDNALAAGRLALDLRWFWIARGMFSEGVAWINRVLGSSEKLGNKTLQAQLFDAAGIVSIWIPDLDYARRRFEEGLALFRELGDKKQIAWVLALLGTSRMYQGESDGAAQIEEGVALARAIGDQYVLGMALVCMGEHWRLIGDETQAIACNEEGLECLRESGHAFPMSAALVNLVNLSLRCGNIQRAAEFLTELLAIARQSGDTGIMVYTLAATGGVAIARGDYARGVRLFGGVDSLLKFFGIQLQQTDKDDYDRSLALARAQMNEIEFNTAWEQGKVMTSKQAIEYAMQPPNP